MAYSGPPRGDFPSLLSDDDLYFFHEGTHTRLYEKLGAHPGLVDGEAGTFFAVWAPNAEQVSLIGDFNGWSPEAHPMRPRGSSGIWETFAPGVGRGALYKYQIRSRYRSDRLDKADPFGFLHETPPGTASIVWDLHHEWGDARWMAERARRNSLQAPISIYEVHLGSWARVPEEGDRMLGYREIAPRLADYVLEHGYTHVEMMPVMEHPFRGSWGYQVTGYFAPTHRQGKPEDFMWLVDHLHQRGIGVILDWVPAHFPNDEHGLGLFDGTHLYEHADPRKGFHPDWRSFIFNYGRHEVRSFLLSSAMFWLDRYHADGLRVDGVTSMLYLDYSRKEGEWIPNEHGGRENLEAIAFLKQLNEQVYRAFPDVQTIAEESTAWPLVSRPTSIGGLGFGLKWDMGWMHDSLRYLERDPIYRRWHHDEITFRSLYAFNENFVLPLSHDEVVHGKGSLLNKMPGDRWQKFANLRLLFAHQFAQPGKKLIFMGSDFGQWREWNHDMSLDWHLADEESHVGLRRLVTDLNRLYRTEPALHRYDCEPRGFRWVDGTDAERSVIAYLRLGDDHEAPILCVFNFTPVVRYGYALGVPLGGRWVEVLNTDAREYGGSGVGNLGGVDARDEGLHGMSHRLELTLPPLACVLLRAPV
jgi:1,4-alpha-glucan branching enzyme